MVTIDEIQVKLTSYSVDALIMHHILVKKKSLHLTCINALKNIDGGFYGFIDAYNDGMDALCEVQDFLEPVAMRNQVQIFFNAFGGAWHSITPKIADEFIDEHQMIINTIDEVLRTHKF